MWWQLLIILILLFISPVLVYLTFKAAALGWYRGKKLINKHFKSNNYVKKEKK